MPKLSSTRTVKIGAPSTALIVILIGALFVGYVLTLLSAIHSFVLIILLLIFVCVFVWPEAGLYVVIFSMLLSPEIIAGEMVGKGTLGRGLTLRLEDFLLVFIGLSWFARNAVDKTTGLFRKTPLNQPIAAYIIVCLVATLWGKITGDVEGFAGFFFVLKYFEYMIVFFMVVNYVNTADQAKRLLFCLFLTCFIVSIYGLMQIPGGERVSAPFEGARGEPNTFGGYLVFMGAVAVALIDHLKDMRVRLGLAVLLVALLVSLLYTQSRASYLAVIPTYLTLSLLSRRRFYLVAGLIVIVALSPVILPHVAKKRIAYTFTQPTHRDQIQIGKLRLDTSLSARITSWKEGLSEWRNKPILGHGVTGHKFMDAQYPRILVETGVVGLLAFGWLIYILFLVGLRTWRNQQNDLLRGLSVGFIAGLVGLLVHAFGANTFIIVRIMEPFWFLTGIVIALAAMDEESRAVAVS
ncbi:MAG: O-antigen ligase family protein [Syntrophobacterales bacterium]|jgi:O-antigen ligase